MTVMKLIATTPGRKRIGWLDKVCLRDGAGSRTM